MCSSVLWEGQEAKFISNDTVQIMPILGKSYEHCAELPDAVLKRDLLEVLLSNRSFQNTLQLCQMSPSQNFKLQSGKVDAGDCQI